jgi:pilus assembly protein CpaE
MKLKVISPIAAHAEAWCTALSRGNLQGAVEAIHRPLHEVNVLVNGSRPDLVVVEVATPRDFDALETLAARHPDIEYVLVSDLPSPDQLMRAMRAGVREVLPAPATVEAVVAAVERQVHKRLLAAAPLLTNTPAATGQVIAFLGCKGGSGATFTAANVAHLIAADGQHRVALIDLNLQFGDALLFISSASPPSDVAAVASNIERLDADLLRSAMLQVSPGLHVLAAPEDPAQSSTVTAAHIQAIVQLARSVFDVVVIDAGRSLSSVTLQALDLADRVYAVLQLTLPHVRDGKRLREVFRSLGYPDTKVAWIVNRHEKGGQITLDDLRRTLGITDVMALPNQYEAVAASVNQGVPVAQIAPGNPITRSLRALARSIAPVKTEGAGEDGLRGRWLSQLFRPAPPSPAAH